jgi:hypothetical protein
MGREDATARNGGDSVDALEHAQLVEPAEGTEVKESGPEAAARETKGEAVACVVPAAP